MVAKFARGASAAWDALWANGWASGRDSIASPIAKLKRKSAHESLPGFGGRQLIPPGATPIRFNTPKPVPEFGPGLGRIGSLEVRLATRKSDIRRAQRLRYQVFYEEMAAIPSGRAMLARRDVDAYDAVCDHLLVIDHSATEEKPFRKPRPKVVGTYRLLRGEAAERSVGFYSASEYDLAPLLAAHPGKRLLELGRSCVLKPYRTKRTVELLWAGIYAYVLHHRIDALIGCASLEGIDPDRLALPLSFLHHYACAPKRWSARALPERHVPMDRLSREAIDPKAALRLLPPLIKGYLRLGATFGDGAVIDRQFGTTDVFVVLPIAAIGARYLGHFAPDATRWAA